MNITVADLGWLIVAWLAAGTALSGLQGWFTGQYAVTRRGARFIIARRWYGRYAHVCLRDAEGDDRSELYLVLEWDRDHPGPLWVRVVAVDNEDAESFWAPVSQFTPYSVRKFRPRLVASGRIPVPVLFWYVTGDGT
jgi:hypothetical protein